MEYLGTIYKGSQSDIIFPVPFIELSDGATVDFYTDGEGGFSRTKDEIKIDNYMLKTTASADELNALNDGVLNYTINTCMGKSEGDTGLYLSEPTSYVEKQYLTADNVKTINGESIVGQGNIEIEGGGDDYVWEWNRQAYETGTTKFTDEEIQSAIDAYESGKRIVIYNEFNMQYIYPYSVQKYKGLFNIYYMFDDDIYVFKFNSDDNNSQSLSRIDQSEVYVWGWWKGQWAGFASTATNFSYDTILKVMEAYERGKIIVINYINNWHYTTFNTSLMNDVITIYFGDGTINFKWRAKVSKSDEIVESQSIERMNMLKNSSATSITCRKITTNGHGDLDTAISDLQKQIDNSETSKLQEEISALTEQITLEIEDRVKNDEILQSTINFNLDSINRVASKTNDNTDNIIILESSATTLSIDLTALSGSVVKNYYTKTEVDGKIPTKTSQLTNDSGYLTSVPDGYAKTADIEKTYLKITDASATYQPKGNYLTEHQSLEEYYTKSQCNNQFEIKGYSYSKSESDTNYASKTDTYTKEEIDSKIGDINNILETI